MNELSHTEITKTTCIDKFTAAIEVLSELSMMFDDIDYKNESIKLVIGDLCTAREHLSRDLDGG